MTQLFRSYHSDGFSWRGDLGHVDFSTSKYRRQYHIILQPRATNYSGPSLIAWIEETRMRFQFTFDDARARPKRNAAPTWAPVIKKLEPTYREIPLRNSMSYIVARALAKNELIGEAAQIAIDLLFNDSFVDDPKGFDYLCKYASAKTISWHARELAHNDVVPATTELAKAEEIVRRAAHSQETDRNAVGDDTAQGRRWMRTLYALRRLATDDDFRDAIVMVNLAGQPHQTDPQIWALLETHVVLPNYRGLR